MAEFTISFEWRKRDEPYEVNEERLRDGPLLWASFQRFIAEYRGVFFIPLAQGELELWFDYDLSQVFDHLPEWLQQLSSTSGKEAELLFASQGTELKLVAIRAGDRIALRSVSIAPGSKPANDELPDLIPASRFFSEWKRFLGAVLDALEEFEPALGGDREFRDYREALRAIE